MLIVLIYNYIYNVYLFNHVAIYFIVILGVLLNVKFNRGVVIYLFIFFMCVFWAILATVEINSNYLNRYQAIIYTLYII